LSSDQIKAISARLSAEADGASAGLAQQIAVREKEAKAIASEVAPAKPTGPPSTLARNLLPMLQGFDGLYEPSLSAIQIAPLPGSGQPFYWPFLVRREHLAEGLIETLMRSPWELQATRAKMQTDVLPPQRLTDEAIASLAHDLGCNAILLYRLRPDGLAPWVKVELVLYDGSSQQIIRSEASLIGRSTGLVILNPLMIVLAVLAFLGALGWAIVISLRGSIVVRVQWDADAKDELFSILISRSPQTPSIDNITAYRKKLEWLGKRKRRFEAWNIDQNTTFRGIPRGKWHVHLFGIYTRGRQTMMLREPSQEVEVLARKTAFVAHVLEAAEAEFKIVVVDDHGAVDGARVWLDDERAKAVAAAKDGSVTLKVPKGFHVIHVSARGMTVERPYHVVKSKVHEMTINLVWERRQEYVSRALERQVDEASAYMTHAPRGSGTVASAATAATMVPHPASAVVHTTTPAEDRKPAAGIEISLEDTPVVDLVAAPSPADMPPPVDTAPTVFPQSRGKLTMSLRPLSSEMAETILPSTLLGHSSASPHGSSPAPASAGPDIVDLPFPAGAESPVDFGAALELEGSDKTNPNLSDPRPPASNPSPRRPR
jgi:hypothetical protein